MSSLINNIEYLVPSPDKKIGFLSFTVDIPILFDEKRKALSEAQGKDIEISQESTTIAEKLAESILKDLEK